MRKVTEQSANAFNTGRAFRSSNTTVTVTPESVQMRLYGHLIAEKTGSKLVVNSCGWMTVTTKERLNGIPGVSVQQRNFQWFLNGQPWNGGPAEIQNSL